MNYRKAVLSLFAIACVGQLAYSQDDSNDNWKLLGKKDTSLSNHSIKQPLAPEQNDDSAKTFGNITIYEDERIGDLLKAFEAADKKLAGFRIQVFLGKAKAAQKVRTAFVSKYPDIPAYAQWQSPNMKVRVGDLRTRLDAERVLLQIKMDFPGAYIVSDNIELPDLALPKLDGGKVER